MKFYIIFHPVRWTKLALKTLFPIFSILFLFLSLTAPVSANPDDWGMVQRFNKQHALAELGNIKAMYDVGKLYQRGRGVIKNMKKAAEYFQKASSADHPAAQARLGILYFEGRGVKQDYKKAITLLNSSANKNIPSAQFQLANMYELGTGVKKSLTKAIAWYKKADRYGYYLAKEKVSKLQNILKNKGSIKRKATAQAATPEKKALSPLIQTILKGKWLKRSKAVGYLPSAITNCVKESNDTLHCISTSQERSTGSEMITYNTESIISVIDKSKFTVVYSNNVLDVTLLTVVDGDGEIIEQTSSRIKKGKQGKKRTLNCYLNNNKSVTCHKGSSSFDLVNQ